MQNNMLDILHRSFLAYHKEAENDTDYRKFQQLILRTDQTEEWCNTTLSTCDIQTDWIERIEAALPFLERAVSENRQFILRQGEIVPIEKMRRVSKTSVEHLARHSELITREPAPGDDIIPEKMLMTENIGTYTVYENRFLYMLLCYIKDFVEIKYSKISDLSNFFSSETVFEKNLSGAKRNLHFSLKFQETASGVSLPELTKETTDCLSRMKNILASVDTLLKTSLMIEVSSAPMLKPPITRTNVLMHNPCFVAAIDLYDYLCTYTGDGYTTRDLYTRQGELTDTARSDYAELVAFVSYLAYRQGGLYNDLVARYLKEEERRQEEERQAKIARLNELKSKLESLDPKTAEYILALEDQCKDAKAEPDELSKLRQMLQEADKKLTAANHLRIAANAELDQMKEELKRREWLERASGEKHRVELDQAKLLIHQKNEEIETISAEYEAKLETLNEQFRTEYATLAEKYHLLHARIHAIQSKDVAWDSDEEDFSTKEAFAKLEAEYRAFRRFFNAQWKIAKQRIRENKFKKKSNQ